MKVIDYDPRIRVPDISEKIITSGMVISDLIATHCHFISFMKKEDDYIYSYGCDIKNNLECVPINWYDEWNRNNCNIISAIIKEWTWLPVGWQLKYIIIESEIELHDFMTKYRIGPYMKHAMITYWTELHGSE